MKITVHSQFICSDCGINCGLYRVKVGNCKMVLCLKCVEKREVLNGN